ncbi:hypothetical protein NL389_30215, partial [Klebsiella pneumoniae]|nr:hypothetical protein [Klebsiella pneumoniae]
KNIDKSLHRLLLEFSVDAKVEKNVSSIYEDLIKSLNETKKKLNSIKKEKIQDENLSSIEVLLEWSDINNNIKNTNSRLYDRPINNFMSILNSFFKETKREFFIDDNGFLVLRKKINRGLGNRSLNIKWYDLSKGEKNLLTLL